MPWTRPATLDLSRRGALVAVRGIAGGARLRGDVARRAADAAQAHLWEQRRMESEWEVVDLVAASPGAFLQVEAVFETGRAAFCLLAERGLRAEVLGERAARRVLKFIDDEEAVVDPWLADQMAVPLALAGGGGRLADVRSHLAPRDGGGGPAPLRRAGRDVGPARRAGGPRRGARLTGARHAPSMGPAVIDESRVRRSAAVRLLLWDYARGSLAYDLAFVTVVLLVLLVPGGFWGDPLWRP